MLVYQLIALELDNSYRRNYHSPSSRRNPRQQPINHRGMRKVDDEFVDDRVRADRAANRRQAKIGWIDGDEMKGVEALQLFVSHPTSHGRNVIDIRLRNHGGHRGLHIPRLELVAA